MAEKKDTQHNRALKYCLIAAAILLVFIISAVCCLTYLELKKLSYKPAVILKPTSTTAQIEPILSRPNPLSPENTKSDSNKELVLEIKTIEAMVDQLEKMPQVTDDERNARAQLSMDIHDRLRKITIYEIRDNLNLWKLVARWATAEGVSERSPYVNAPFFHIQRLRPDYQKEEELIGLMAKLNAIRNEEHQDLEIDGYRNFVHLFEECDTCNPEIQLQIGMAYGEGYGLLRNNIEALKWYRRAAAAGNADAIGELGEAYIYGTQYGIEEDVEKGLILLNEAVVKGSASAAYTLGRYYQPSLCKLLGRKGDRNKAIEYFQIATERGYTDAFAPLAEEYVEVGNGTEALRWANGGDKPNASDMLEYDLWTVNRHRIDSRGRCSYIKGEVYALGIGGIEQDLNRAKELFEESYRKGLTEGAHALSAMYRVGIGVDADADLARQWQSNAIKVSPRPNEPWVKRWHEEQINLFAEKLRKAVVH